MSSVSSVVSQVLRHEQRSSTVSKNMLTDGVPVQEKEYQRCYVCLHGSHGWSSGWKREIWELGCFFTRTQSWLTMPLKRVKGNRNRGNNNAIVAIFVSITANPNIHKCLLWGCLTLTLTNLYVGKVNFTSQLSSDTDNTLYYVSHLPIHINWIWGVMWFIENMQTLMLI